MKKEIVINAGKDRARIAIVEDGRLAELYVEHPDNVRTLGNIYLGKVAKVMPQIHAAFVDIGQKQDAFLHFSDLTDNAAQLFAMAGEDIPGLEGNLILSHAPQKRVADDEDEPDVEETLEVEDTPEESKTARTGRSRSRRRRRRRGGRGRNRSQNDGGKASGAEEEEEQEERQLPHVIDLTQKTGSVRPKPKKARGAASGEASDDEAKDEKPKRSRTRSRKKDNASQDSDSKQEAASDDAGPDATSSEDEASKERKPKRSRSRSRKRKSDDDADTAKEASSKDDAPQDDADGTSSENGEKPKDEKPKRSRSRNRKKSQKANAPEASGDDTDDASHREKHTIDLTSSAPPRSRRRSATDDRSQDGDDDTPEADRSGDEKPSRSRRRGGRSRGSDHAPEADDNADEKPTRSRRRKSDRGEDQTDADANDSDADSSGRSRRGRGRNRKASGDDHSGSSDSKDDNSDDGDKDSSRGRSRGRSRDSGGRSNGGGRSSKGSGGGRSGGNRSSGKGKASGAKVPTNPEDLLKRNSRVLVKITKEPISSKGSRVSTDISLAGRFLVLVPAADYVAVSKKIESSKERRRLRALATSLKPDNCGVIVRTVAGGRDAKALDQDLRLLITKWRKIEKKLAEDPQPPALLHEDLDMVSSIVRDLFTSDFDRILVDDPRLHRKLQNYVKAVAPQMAERVVMHRSNQAVFRAIGIEKQVAEAFSERVNMKGGGYLIIEHTEAMHVVDVNSGRAGRGKRRAEENLLAVNLESAREIARQLRLRDLGGIICVDFIDLRHERDRRKVTDAIKQEFAKDRAVTKVIGMSDFGVMQITRQRLRPSITAQDDSDGVDAMEAAGATEIVQPDRDHPEPEASGDDGRDDDNRGSDDRSSGGDRRRSRGRGRSTDRDSDRSGDDGSRQRRQPAEDVGPAELAERVRAWLAHYRDEVDDRYARRPIVVNVHPLLGSYLRRGFPSPLTRLRFRLRNLPFRLADDPKVDPLEFEVQDEKSGRSLVSKYPLDDA